MKFSVFTVAVACGSLFAFDSAWSAVGRTPANFGVSQGGAAQYSIPIFAPPGTAGMTPQISLTYSSHAGDDIAGAGFFIGGLSRINRCNKSIDQDGAAAPPALVIADRFCLDGIQLRLDPASPTGYGAAASIYRTEIETFTRITAFGTSGNGPSYFVAEQKNGLIYEYGNTTNSRIEPLATGGGQSPTAGTWALNRIRDRAGNAIDFVYQEDTTNGSYRPSEIQWTSNGGQGLSPAYKISFVYEATPRPDTLFGYRFGNQSSVSGQTNEIKRLDRIDVLYNTTTIVRRYELSYDGGGAGGRSRVASIQECGMGGTDCLPATTFSWINGMLGWVAEGNTGQPITAQPLVMDVNGDGRDDLVYPSTTGSGVWMLMLANTSGSYNTPVSTGIANTNFANAHPIDWNGDGLWDVLVPLSGGTWWVLQSNGSGFTSINTGVPWGSTDRWWAADVDGDGRGDLVRGFNTADFKARIYVRPSTGSGFGSEFLMLELTVLDFDTHFNVLGFGNEAWRMRSAVKHPDFDNDGREDLVVGIDTSDSQEPPNFERDVCIIYSGSATTAHAGCISNGSGIPQAWLAGDANGDGLTDLYWIGGSDASHSTRMVLNRGTFFSNASSFTAAGYSIASARVADWDGDGRDDILEGNTSTGILFVGRSTGAAITPYASTGVAFGTGSFHAVGDMNGDGLPDLMRANPSGGAWLYSTHLGTPADMLDRATDGYGNYCDFDYVSTAQNNYTKLSGAVYPERDDQPARQVVSQYTATNGVGGTYTVSYWYYGARTQLKGRGFEGFSERRLLDSRSGLYAYEFYKQLFPLTGMLDKSELYQSNNSTPISRLQNTWPTPLSYGSGFETRVLPYVGTSMLTRYELGGTWNGSLISTTTTTNVVDSATGTLTDTTTVTTEAPTANGINASQSYTQRTWHSALFTDSTNWCIGRPSTSQQINSHTMYGGTQITRTLSTTWDGTMCRPTGIVSQPGDLSAQITRTPHYDGFGNIDSVTITGAGMGPITTSTNWGTSGQFPTTVTNALSQTTTNGWDFVRGVPASQTDPNGIAVSWTYDNFGRRTREDRPDSTATTWAYNDCSSIGCVNSNNKMVIVETSLNNTGGTIRDQYTYLDKLDRPLLTRAQTLSGGYNRVEREYDAQGRLYRESSPCWWGSCTSSTSFWTRYTYDALDRLTQASRPINDSSGVYTCAPTDASPPCQHSYVYYEGLTTRTVDAEGKSSQKIASVGGTLSRSQDHAGYNQTFDYDAFGALLRVSDNAAGTTTLQSYTYNINGSRLTSSDVDLGNWSYTPNALGEVISQTDANGAVTTFTYDALGRITSLVFPNAGGSITSTYTFGTSAAAKNIGKLDWQEISGTGITTYRETYTYDSIGRPSQTEYKEGASTFYYVNRSYAAATGFLESLTYPESSESYRLKLRYSYQYGLLNQVSEFNTGTRFWLASATDPRGNVIDETVGNTGEVGLYQTVSGFDQITGRLDYIQTGPGGGSTTQQLQYEWDRVGNLKKRIDVNQSNLTEEFFYDNLHRLDYSQLNGVTNLDVGYDDRGNITSKTGVGTYTYSATRLHAVTSINTGSGTLSYTYDSNGNMLSRAGTAITWYANNLPKSITANSSNSSTFQYTPYGQRWQQDYRANGTTKPTIYIGSLLEKETWGTLIRFKHYIHANGKTVGFYIREVGGGKTRYAVLNDHLNSTDAFYQTNGTLKLKESFDAFGNRRGTNWTGAPTSGDMSQIAVMTRRGFTGHEHLDSTVNLIHMNGRVYDPNIARFISADPFVTNPSETQSYNRYSYVENNPLSFTDPSGFDPKKGPKRFENWSDGDWEVYHDKMLDLSTHAYNFSLFMQATSGSGGSGDAFDFGSCATFSCSVGDAVLRGFMGAGGRTSVGGFSGRKYEWQRETASGVEPFSPENGEARYHSTPGRWVPAGQAFLSAIDGLPNLSQTIKTVFNSAVEIGSKKAKWAQVGAQGEAAAAEHLTANGYVIIAQQLYVDTSAGLRITDFLVTGGRLGDGIAGFEVKVNGSPYTPLQLQKDLLIATQGGIIRSLSKPGLEYGTQIRYETYLMYVDMEMK